MFTDSYHPDVLKEAQEVDMSDEGFLKIMHQGKILAVISVNSAPDEPTFLYVDVSEHSICYDMKDDESGAYPAKFEITIL